MPVHHLMTAVRGTFLFHDHVEAAELWHRLRLRLPGALAACLMPDHVHLLLAQEARADIGDVASGYARWRNARWLRSGPVFAPQPAPETVQAGLKTRRHVRYIHLNPCRGGLVGDPLAWPWSTHRDRLGLALVPWGRRHPDPEALHRYVSSDPAARVDGTPLPWGVLEVPTAAQVETAVTETLRVPFDQLGRRGRARSLWLRGLRALTPLSSSEIARVVGVQPRAVRNVPQQGNADTRLLRRLLGDDRFAGLLDTDLRHDEAVRRYARRKGLRLR